MPQFVLVVLGSLDHVRRRTRILLNFNFNLSAHTACLWVRPHKVVKLDQRVVVWARSDIQQQSKLGLEVFADGLEEPFVRVDFAVVAVLDAKHEVDAAAPEDVHLNAEVPSRDLEAVQDVRWDFL